MKKKTLLLIDFNNLLYRSVFAHQGLSHKGKFTGGVYGFIDMLASAINRYGAQRIAVCMDNKPYLRNEYYPAYKADRVSSLDEDAVKQLAVARKQIKKFLRRFKLTTVEITGMEADDIIGAYCRYSLAYGKILVMSNDSDLYQLLNGQVFMVKTGRLYGVKDFKKEWPKIKPRDWPRCVGLKGSHNGVPGIKGVGDKTAYKVVAEDITDREIWLRWRVRRKTVALKTALATFPFPLVQPPRLPLVQPIKYNAKKFEEELDRHGIRFKDEFHEAFHRLSK